METDTNYVRMLLCAMKTVKGHFGVRMAGQCGTKLVVEGGKVID